jgi:hypothetical protein
LTQEVICMPVPGSPPSWYGSLLWLIALAAAAFGVSRLIANRLRVGRAAYIAAPAVVTGAPTFGDVLRLGVAGMSR